MKQTLPVHLNFRQKCKTGFEIQGNWPIKQLKRLNEFLLSDEGDIKVELKFDFAGHIPCIKGHITAELQLKCQRCMQSMTHTVDNDFKLGLVLNEEQMNKLPDDFEPYLVVEDNNHLPDMIEDELLLSLPLVPMHEHECSEYVKTQGAQQDEDVSPVKEEKENPFSVLKDLL